MKERKRGTESAMFGFRHSSKTLTHLREINKGSNNPMFGKHQTLVTIEKLEKSHQKFWDSERGTIQKQSVSKIIREKNRDPKYRKRTGDSVKIALSNPKIKQRMSNSQKVLWLDVDYKKKMSDKQKEIWSSPIYKERMKDINNKEIQPKRIISMKKYFESESWCKARKEEQLKPQNIEIHRQTAIKLLQDGRSRKTTTIELKVYNQLDQLDIPYEKQKSFKYTDTVPDVFIKPNIVIFLDGCIYHMCPQHFNLKTGKLHDAIVNVWSKKDKINRDRLRAEGKIVVEIWEHDIVKDDFDIRKYLPQKAENHPTN